MPASVDDVDARQLHFPVAERRIALQHHIDQMVAIVGIEGAMIKHANFGAVGEQDRRLCAARGGRRRPIGAGHGGVEFVRARIPGFDDHIGHAPALDPEGQPVPLRLVQMTGQILVRTKAAPAEPGLE